MEKVDPHNRQKRFEDWKNSDIKDVSPQNAKHLKDFILDLETGLNTGGDKGARSPARLLANISQVKRVMKLAEQFYKIKDITKLKEEQLHKIILDIQQGKIKKESGKAYNFAGDLIKRFKTFWHWYIKVNKKKGIEILDITADLKGESSKSATFVYFTKEQLEKLVKEADRDLELKTFMVFLYDTGIRSPTEALNTRVSDFSPDYKHLSIRDEISKTFGRKIRLMFCSDAIKRYIEGNELKDDDLVFTFSPSTMNDKLKRIGRKVLSDKQTLGKKKGSDLTMYDFRHSSACYWLPRYKVRSQLLYRFGWKQEKEIHYYSNLLGMSDGITEEDLMVGMDKTEIEKRLVELERSNEQLKKIIQNEDKMNELQAKIMAVMNEKLKQIKR
jgi:integrase